MRKDNLDPRFRAAYLLSTRKTETIIAMIVGGFVLSFGFLLGHGNNMNYDLIYSFAGPIFWFCLFFFTSLVRLISLFSFLDSWKLIINSLIALWGWTYIFLSFTVFDKTPIAPTELLLAVPAIIETWLLTAILFSRRCK
jgi:hypothetical protein